MSRRNCLLILIWFRYIVSFGLAAAFPTYLFIRSCLSRRRRRTTIHEWKFYCSSQASVRSISTKSWDWRWWEFNLVCIRTEDLSLPVAFHRWQHRPLYHELTVNSVEGVDPCAPVLLVRGFRVVPIARIQLEAVALVVRYPRVRDTSVERTMLADGCRMPSKINRMQLEWRNKSCD